MIKKPDRLSYILGTNLENINKIIENIDDFYYEDIKTKKNGKLRILHPSIKELKVIQGKIKTKILETFHYPEHIQGGVKKRDNISNAVKHLGKKFKFNTDLKDFFPSIGSKQVYQMFINNCCSPDVSSYLTKLTTYKGKLPQGTPTSTHISNLVFIPIDNKILEICKLHSITYTRFIDDLTLSSQTDFEDIIPDILDVIKHSGFKISHRKTFYKLGTTEVTGIMVKNNNLDIKDEQKKKLKNPELPEASKKGLTNYTSRVKNHGKIRNQINNQV